MLKKIAHIAIGWGKRLGVLQTSRAENKLSMLRLKTCKACPDAKRLELLEILNGDAHYTDTLVCTRCHCPCLQKTLVVDEICPIGKW